MIRRNFIPGSEWLYYKLYCGYGTADELLKTFVSPLSASFIEQGLIDSWFFIRYADPKPHVRWRLHFSDLSKEGEVMVRIAEAINTYLDAYLINKVQIDTYKREIERYGEETMELCEQLFGFDSIMITNALQVFDTLPNKETYRWLFSLMDIDALLDDFGYEYENRHEFVKTIADGFGKEFGMNEQLIKQFSDKYRASRETILRFMNGSDENAAILRNVVKKRSENTQEIIKSFKNFCPEQTRIDDIMRSLVHMTMNRLFVAQQRKHEAVLYGFLERYYRSELAKNKYCKKN